MKDFVVVSKIYNNQLRQRREELELSCPKFAEKIGVSYARYLDYETLKSNPYKRSGELTDVALKICEFHGLSADELFPQAIEQLAKRIVTHQFDASEVRMFMASTGAARLLVPSPDEFLEDYDLCCTTRKVLATLTPREEKVLRMRFGIGEEKEFTCKEIGDDFEITPSRATQIEDKALRKLRHPSRSKKVRQFLGGEFSINRQNKSTNLHFVSKNILDIIAAVFADNPGLFAAHIHLGSRQRIGGDGLVFYGSRAPKREDPRWAIAYSDDFSGDADRGRSIMSKMHIRLKERVENGYYRYGLVKDQYGFVKKAR